MSVTQSIEFRPSLHTPGLIRLPGHQTAQTYRDGCSKLLTFKAAILAFVYSFGNLQVAIFLVGPGETTIPVQMFSMLEFRSDPTVAAVACINIVVVTGLMLIANRFVGTKTLMQL
jgi:hypothetical protein